MEHRITITTEGNGRDLDTAESLLNVLHERYPRLGAVVAQNTEDDTLSVTVALPAFDATSAIATAAGIVAECFSEVPQKAGRVIAAESEIAGELEPVV